MANNYIRDFIKITLNNIEFIIQSDGFDSKGCINSCVQIQIEFCLAPKVMFFLLNHTNSHDSHSEDTYQEKDVYIHMYTFIHV